MTRTAGPADGAGAPDVPRIQLAPGLTTPRVLNGLWQVADMERHDGPLDIESASDALVGYADAGFDGFDMADHYGTAELIAGRARQKLIARDGATDARFCTKWCPAPDEFGKDAVRAGVQSRLDRLGVERVDLLQVHWWDFTNPGWIEMMDELSAMKAEGAIGALGFTNVDADHLHTALAEGYEIATNQVSFSVIDRRAAGAIADVCAAHDVKLLAYGTLAGGFLSRRWLGVAEPAEIGDWSKMKYKRFIDAAGGWDGFQTLLSALNAIALRHGCSIPNVATRWVLDHDAVGAVIVGARISEREHRADTRDLFTLALDAEDHERLNEAFAALDQIPGDCGDEYRRPPFLTASGDLSDHLEELPAIHQPVKTGPDRFEVSSGSVWEDICGFCRAVRIGDRILVSGTTATHGADRAICKGDVRGQTVFILDKIAGAVAALGGDLTDAVRTRIYLRNPDDWEAASRVHGRYFRGKRPANTLIAVRELIGGYDIEIEVEAPASRPING